MKRTWWLVPTVLAALILSGPAVSQEGGAEPVQDFVFEAPEGGMAVTAFLEILREYTEANVLFDPNNPQVRGKKIEIKGAVRIPKERIFSWVRSVLFYHRLVLVPSGPRQANTWALLDLNAPQITSHPEYVPESEISKWADEDGAYIVTVVSLKHLADTSRARNALAQLSTRQVGRINDIPQSRSFVIGDFAPVVHGTWKMLHEMDEAARKNPAPPPARSARSAQHPITMEQHLEQKILASEQALVGSRTSQAAQYFLTKVRKQKAELQKLRATKD